jgi:hypothetical protein
VPTPIRAGLVGLWVVFLLGWVLGFPLIILGLSNSAFPPKLNLTSGVLGHLMNLVNPLLYGVFWYSAFVEARAPPPSKECEVVQIAESTV